MAHEIAIGVVSGILTSLVIAVVVAFFNRVVIPWYRERIYRGVILDGKWNGSMTISSITYDLQLIINQKGTNIDGAFSARTQDPNAPNKASMMNFRGEIKEGYALLNCYSIDRQDISFGSMMLKIRKERLSGKQIFRDLTESTIDVFSSKVEFLRA